VALHALSRYLSAYFRTINACVFPGTLWASQKYWEDDVQISDGSGSISIDYDQEEEVLSKAECEVFFREEVRAWLDENGSALFGTGMPIPKLVRTDVKSSNSTPSKNTPYKPPYKKQRATVGLADEAIDSKSVKTSKTLSNLPKLFE